MNLRRVRGGRDLACGAASPTSGISGAEEQERRATSATLAVLSSVKEFGKAVTGPLGAPSGAVETFVEVPFYLGEQRVYPDGLIRVSRGSRTWVALVEVKTGSNRLEAAQLEAYLDVARENGYDAVLTISNEIPAIAGTHPTTVDRRELRKVALHHFSWTQVLTEAVMQKVHRGVADPDQAWILGELIRNSSGTRACASGSSLELRFSRSCPEGNSRSRRCDRSPSLPPWSRTGRFRGR